MSKGLTTLGTGIRLGPCVNPLVLRKVYFLVEGSPAFTALVRSFASMDFPVLNQG